MQYFQELKAHNKLLYRSVAIFCGFTLFLSLLGHQITPFFLWAMFSENEQPKYEQEIIDIKINGKPFNYTQELIDANRHIVIGTLHYYYDMKTGSNIDPNRQFFKDKLGNHYKTIQPAIERLTNDATHYKTYENWLHRYLERSTHQSIQTLEIGVQTWQYTPDGKLNYLNSKPLLSYGL